MKLKNNWRLPKPPKPPSKEWLSISRCGRIVPFGYYEDPDNSYILRPIPKELEALEKAKKFMKEFPHEEVANWLTEESGRSITVDGLRKRVALEKRYRKDASNLNFYAKRYKEAWKAAKKLEEERVGGSKTYRIIEE